MSNLRLRKLKDRALTGSVNLLTYITVLPLFLILGTIFAKGVKQLLNFDFFAQTAPSSLDAQLAQETMQILPGGIANGIVGTLLMVLFASLFAIPTGILGGIYLSEHRDKRLASLIRFLTDLLQGTPSIVVGIIIYAWVVVPMGSYSALAGALALAFMMLPLIIRSTEETLCRLPDSLKESALALGCSYSSVVIRVLLPAAMGGLLTGTLLAISRIIGETAPLMMTALGSTRINWELDRPVSAVPLLIWEFYNDPNLLNMIWSSSLFLLLLVLSLNILAKRLAAKWRIVP